VTLKLGPSGRKTRFLSAFIYHEHTSDWVKMENIIPYYKHGDFDLSPVYKHRDHKGSLKNLRSNNLGGC
jgi:hypothetical protein